jgi:putative membrane protein
MKWILKITVNTLAILLSAHLLPGVKVPNYSTALAIALTLSILNIFFKPLFTNAFMILIADYFIDTFSVGSFWNAFLFSLLLWMVNSIFDKIIKKDQEEVNN